MNFIAGALLLYLNPENDKSLKDYNVIDTDFETRVFWIFAHILKEKNWRLLFMDGTPGIYVMIDNLKKKMSVDTHAILNHLNKLAVIY